MKKRAKHYDNKRDLIQAMRITNKRAQKAEENAFSSQMLLTLYVLHSKFGFGQDRCERFVNAVGEADNLELNYIRNYLSEKIGFAVELPDEHIITGNDVEAVRIEL